MHEIPPMNHEMTATISWGSVIASLIGFLLTLAFGAWAFVVKHFGQQHVDSVRELAGELREVRGEIKELRGEFAAVTTRVARIEFVQSHYHPEMRNHD